jgi:hypothetical protein
MAVTKKRGLNLLAAFLNSQFGEDGKREATFTNRWSVRFDNQKLRTLQKQLTEALAPIASYGQQGQLKPDELEHNLKRLVDQINKLDFKTRYEVVSGPSISWLPTLKFSGSRFHLMRMSFADVDQPHLELYEIILDSMVRGSFDRLRRCKKCKLFFVGGKAGADYCRDKCRADFHNGSSERVKRWRDETRKKKLRNAKELAEKGWSIYRISEQIGLSERILRRAKINHLEEAS